MDVVEELWISFLTREQRDRIFAAMDQEPLDLDL